MVQGEAVLTLFQIVYAYRFTTAIGAVYISIAILTADQPDLDRAAVITAYNETVVAAKSVQADLTGIIRVKGAGVDSLFPFPILADLIGIHSQLPFREFLDGEELILLCTGYIHSLCRKR